MKVILVHGYNRNKKDLYPMKRHLKAMGYECLAPTFPLRYKEFDQSTELLVDYLEQFASGDEKVHLVGHSTGGLVIRHAVSAEGVAEKVGRAVLIATPNKGSQLAEFAGRSPGYVQVFKTLKSLHRKYIEELSIPIINGIEIGAIAGNKPNGLLGRLIHGEHDGRVAVSSVNLEHFKDFLILPYHHHEIHHQQVTAEFVDRFLKKGHFKKGDL